MNCLRPGWAAGPEGKGERVVDDEMLPTPPWAPYVPSRAELDAFILRVLQHRGADFVRHAEGQFLVSLPGENRLATPCWLVVGEHSLLIEAFVMRHADENHARLYDFLLQRNTRMYGVSFALDADSDVYVVGRLPLHSVTGAEIDRILGCVLTYVDENFNAMLGIGFSSAIRREWAWRTERGESLANLQAFSRFADPG